MHSEFLYGIRKVIFDSIECVSLIVYIKQPPVVHYRYFLSHFAWNHVKNY